MYTLYHCQISCSSAVKIALEVIGVEHDTVIVNILEGEQHKPEFVAINPLAKIPVLVEGKHVMTQGEAILVHLSQKHQDANLMPNLASEQGMTALKWLNFVANGLHGHFNKIFHPENVSTDPLTVKENAEAEITKLLNIVEDRLKQSTMLAGEQPTLADFYFAVILGWGQMLSFDLYKCYPIFAQYKKQLQQMLPQSQTLQLI